MEDQQLICRQPIALDRICVLGVISFKYLDWNDHVVQIVDINSRDVVVESEEHIDPGFVWFHSRIEGYRGGVILWDKKEGTHYRMGIRFVPLSAEDEHTLQHWPPCSGQLRPCRSPEEIITTLVKSMKQDD